MNSKERLMTAIRCETPDRVPVAPWGLGDIDPESKLAEELIDKTDIIFSVSIANYNPFFGVAVEKSKTQKDDKIVTTLHTPDGDLTQVIRKTAETQAVVDYFCNDIEDIKKILSIPFEVGEPDLDKYWEKINEIKNRGLVMADIANAMCFPATILSPENMCLLWMDERELMKKLINIASKRLNKFIEKACQKGVKAFRIVGGEYATQQLGPQGFKKLVKPADIKLCEIIHRYNGIAHYHNHGYVNRFLEDFIELGIDSLDPLEIPPYGDVDLVAAKEVLKDKICIIGPLDDMEILNKKDKKEVIKMGKNCIKAAGPDGYILGGTTSGIFGKKAAKNFLDLVEVSEKLA